LLQPAARVVENVVPHFWPTVIKPGIAPRRRAPPIIVKVNPALAVLAPSVELPHIARGIAQVVVNNVHNYCDAAFVCLLHERTESVRSTILFLYCEDVSRVVSPGSIGLEFASGHDFNRV